MLLYLNHGWQLEWGGVLELGACRILPEFGRMVVFECGEKSWHGHPAPITDGRWRKSLAVYFYDALDDVPVSEDHSTVWAEP